MKYFMVIVVISMGLVFFMPWHGLTGALLLGMDILGLDFYWQWVRWRQSAYANRIGSMGMVICGYVVRLVSVLALLKIGQAWLTPQAFWVCAAISLAIPVINILGAYMLMQRGIK